jgi:large subunit ribosomal protein LX
MGGNWAPFASEVETDTPAKARERIYSDYGSKHHVRRRYINILKVEEVKEKEASH